MSASFRVVYLMAVVAFLHIALAASSGEIINPYKELGLRRSATTDEVKKAYRRLAKLHHPDKSDSPDADAEFGRIAQAYEILSDEQLRREYDQDGTLPGQAPAQQRSQHPYFRQQYQYDQRFKQYMNRRDPELGVKLTGTSFDHLTGSVTGLDERESLVWLVYVFGDHCAACDRLAPVWRETARALKGAVHTGRVHSDYEAALVRKLGVRHLPTFVAVYTQHGKAPSYSFYGLPYHKVTTAGLVAWASGKFEAHGARVHVLSPDRAASRTLGVRGALRHVTQSLQTFNAASAEAAHQFHLRVFVFSDKEKPQPMLRALADKYRGTHRFAYICVPCVSDDRDVHRQLATLLDAGRIVDTEWSDSFQPVWLVRREPGTADTVFTADQISGRGSLEQLLHSHRLLHVPRLDSDNAYELCWQGVHMGSSAVGEMSRRRPASADQPLCLIFFTRSLAEAQRAALPLLAHPAAAGLVEGAVDRASFSGSDSGSGSGSDSGSDSGAGSDSGSRSGSGSDSGSVSDSGSSSGSRSGSDSGSDSGAGSDEGSDEGSDSGSDSDSDSGSGSGPDSGTARVQLAWVNTAEQKDFANFFVRAASDSRPDSRASSVHCVLWRAATGEFAILTSQADQPSTDDIVAWLAKATDPGFEFMSGKKRGGVPFPAVSPTTWSLPSFSFGAFRWLDGLSSTGGEEGGLVTSLMGVLIVIMMFFITQIMTLR